MPALRRGTVVLCDRFSDSTFAYQGFARGLDLQWLRAANEVATGGLTPDLTLVLDLPVSVGLARRRVDRGQQNRLDRETERFHRKVRRGFLALAAEEPARMTIVNANRPAQEVRDELTEIVIGWMARPTSPSTPPELACPFATVSAINNPSHSYNPPSPMNAWLTPICSTARRRLEND